jgi:CBS domain containing-hemolysin-like protein
MTSNEQFFDLYRELENLLTATGTRDMLESFKELASHDTRLTPYIDELSVFRTLRNIEAHRPNTSDYYEISSSTISLLETIIDLIKHPITADRVAIPISRLVTADLNDSLMGLVTQMVTKPYSNIPILDSNKHLLGVLSDNVILQLLHAKKGQFDSHVIIGDIMNLLKVENHVKETYVFVARRSSLSLLVDIFKQPYVNGKRIAALFVTQNGNDKEAILGMITPSDVLSKVKLI